jgi:hypothetical protein
MEALPPGLRLDKEVPKVLGIPWTPSTDMLSINFPRERITKLTRRTVLRAVAGIFDPLGLVGPCLLKPKLLFQTLWDRREWDAPLEPDKVRAWREHEDNWLGQKISIPRRTGYYPGSDCQLHVFVDAAKDVYACAVYLRNLLPEGIRTHLVFAKSRLRPRNTPMSIPNMELMAMVIGVRALTLVRRELRLPGDSETPQFLWGDNKCVLAWINSREHLPRFVANRIAEIRRHEYLRFAYVETRQNPADIGTRGEPPVTPGQLQDMELWWHGPKWLQRGPEEWPTELCVTVEPIPVEPSPVAVLKAGVRFREPEVHPEHLPGEIVETRRFNSWDKLVRVLAFVRRFLDRARKKSTETASYPTPTEYHSGRKMALRLAQTGIGEIDSRVRKFTDTDGIWRLRTRIIRSGLPTGAVSPVILPRKSDFARLIINDLHRSCCHAGVNATLTEFLLRYWMPEARRAVKTNVAKCSKCRRAKGPAFALPIMPDLPADRVTRRRAFESIGVDYLGPTVTRGAGPLVKTWIVLITCLTTRAVYLEPVWDLSAKSFLQVFKRFLWRRGKPDRVLSDNGTQFRLAARTIATCASTSGIEWNFISQLSPWQGGIYERIVALVKNAFKTTLGRRVLDKEDMRTFTAEVESALNNRPLTYVSTDAGDEAPLRPSDFLNPTAEFKLEVEFPGEAPGDIRKSPPGAASADLLRHWESQEATQDYFWNRWSKDYLLMLRDKSKWFHKNARSTMARGPEIGEVVLIEENLKPRASWTLGRVQDVEIRAGQVRNVKVKLPSGHVWARPLNKVYPVEGELTDSPPDNAAPEPVTESSSVNDYTEAENLPLETHSLKRRSHHMKTRSMPMAAAVGIILIGLAILAFQPATGTTCGLQCTDRGIVLDVSLPVVQVYWCCSEDACRFENVSSPTVRELPERLRQVPYHCIIACRETPGEIPPSEITCQPTQAAGAWPAAMLLVGFILGVISVVIGYFRYKSRRRRHRPEQWEEEGIEMQQLGRSPRPDSDGFVEIPLSEPTTSVNASEVLPYLPDTIIQQLRSTRQAIRDKLGNSPPGVIPEQALPEKTVSRDKPPKKEKRVAIQSTSIAILVASIFLTTTVTEAQLTGNICPGCSVECSTYGVTIVATDSVLKSEICCHGEECSSPGEVKRWEHHVSAELLVNEYRCEGTFWGHNSSTFSYQLVCPPIDECDIIDCRICFDVIANPECYPVWTMIIYGSSISTFVIIACVCLSVCREIRKNCRCILRSLMVPVGCLWRCLRRGTRRTKKRQEVPPHDDRLIRSSVPGHGLLSRTSTWVAIWATSSFAAAGDNAVMMTAETENCYQEDGVRTCRWDYVTTMTLLPAGQPITLLLKDSKNTVFGSLQLTMNALTTNCIPEDKGWLWSYEVRTEASRRCPGMGQCSVDGFCGRVSMDDNITELPLCGKYPSNQFCSESCSTWWCGCPLPPLVAMHVKGCLFYCTYAMPLETGPEGQPSKLYRTFDCPTWEQHVVADVRLETPKGVENFTALLHPGMTYRHANLSMTPLAISQAPAPVMNKEFITDGLAVALADDLPQDLYCASQEEAEVGNCTLAPTACTHCAPDPNVAQVNCQCRDADFNTALEDPTRRLPLSLAKVHLRSENGDVLIETSHAPVQVLVKIENLRIIADTVKATCLIKPMALVGCYHCRTGGSFRFSCVTNTGAALAQVKCEDGTNFAHGCSAEHRNETVTLPFQHAVVDTHCTVSCPGGDTVFRLQGVLKYVPRRLRTAYHSSLTNTSEDSSSGWLPGWNFDFDFDLIGILKNLVDWRIALVVAGVTVIGITAALIVVKLNPVFRGYRILVRLAW